MNNVFNTVLLKAYSDVDDRMKPLILALKKWGKGARVIDSKNNRLASEFLLYHHFDHIYTNVSPTYNTFSASVNTYPIYPHYPV